MFLLMSGVAVCVVILQVFCFHLRQKQLCLDSSKLPPFEGISFISHFSESEDFVCVSQKGFEGYSFSHPWTPGYKEEV